MPNPWPDYILLSPAAEIRQTDWSSGAMSTAYGRQVQKAPTPLGAASQPLATN